MGQGILVTGTDTGAGKTRVAVLLARRLREEGLRLVPFKPVESGCDPGPDGRPYPADAAALRDAASPETPLSSVCLYPLLAPLSPHLAARLEGKRIDVALVRSRAAAAAAEADLVLFEGAGGIAVEIAEGYTFADLARELCFPALVVAENRLGVLNHLRLTLSYLEQSGVRVGGVILNDRSPDPFPAREANEAEVRRIAGRAFLGRVPFGAAWLPDEVAALFRGRFLRPGGPPASL